MELKTKYDIGNTLFFMNTNKVCQGVVNKIEYSVTENLASSRDAGWSPTKSVILYSMKVDYSSNVKLEEKFLFGSKKELLESL